MVKDRLVELNDKQGDEKSRKISSGNVSVSQRSSGYSRMDIRNKNKELTSFLSKCEASTRKLQDLRESVHNLSKVHDDIQATTYDKKLTDKRHKITADIRKLTYEIRDDIRDLKNDVAKIPGGCSEGTAARMAALHLQKLTSDLNECTVNCQTERARFDDRVKARLRREYEVIGDTKTDAELSELIERENFNTFSDVDEMNEARQMLNETVQRQNEVKNLEKAVTEVHELFMDINQLVKDQGEMMQTIEGNVNATRVHIEGGQEQLKKADEYQKRQRRRKICIAAVVITAVVIVASVIAIALAAG